MRVGAARRQRGRRGLGRWHRRQQGWGGGEAKGGVAARAAVETVVTRLEGGGGGDGGGNGGGAAAGRRGARARAVACRPARRRLAGGEGGWPLTHPAAPARRLRAWGACKSLQLSFSLNLCPRLGAATSYSLRSAKNLERRSRVSRKKTRGDVRSACVVRLEFERVFSPQASTLLKHDGTALRGPPRLALIL